MKKTLHLLATLGLALFLVGCRPAIEVSASAESITPTVTAPPDSAFVVEYRSPDAICFCEEDAEQEVADAVNRQLLLIPRWIREAFVRSGWEMSVVGYDIATVDYEGVFEPGKVFGSTSYTNHHIKILNTLRAAANSPIHEMGHWLDHYTQYPTLNDPQFQTIYEEEGELYRSTFGPECSWGVQEFFAEGFWCYWRSPTLLRRTCPMFYEYMSTKLSEAQDVYMARNIVR